MQTYENQHFNIFNMALIVIFILASIENKTVINYNNDNQVWFFNKNPLE